MLDEADLRGQIKSNNTMNGYKCIFKLLVCIICFHIEFYVSLHFHSFILKGDILLLFPNRLNDFGTILVNGYCQCWRSGAEPFKREAEPENQIIGIRCR